MKEFFLILFVVVFLVILLPAIGLVIQQNDPSNEVRLVQLTKIGLVGEHIVVKPAEKTTLTVKPPSFSSRPEPVAEPALTIYWGRDTSEQIGSTIPLRLVKVVLVPEKIVTVEFVFDKKWLAERRVAYTDSEKTNLNWWLDAEMIEKRNFLQVIVRGDQAGLTKMGF